MPSAFKIASSGQKNVQQAVLNLEGPDRLLGSAKPWANFNVFSFHVFNWVSVMDINNKKIKV